MNFPQSYLHWNWSKSTFFFHFIAISHTHTLTKVAATNTCNPFVHSFNHKKKCYTCHKHVVLLVCSAPYCDYMCWRSLRSRSKTCLCYFNQMNLDHVKPDFHWHAQKLSFLRSDATQDVICNISGAYAVITFTRQYIMLPYLIHK